MDIDFLVRRRADLASLRNPPGCLRRIRGKLTQHEVARAAGVPQSSISTLERGSTYGISEKALRRIYCVYRYVKEYARVPDDGGDPALRQGSGVLDVAGS